MIIVVCPAGAVTGGPEALHQLVHTINAVQPDFGAICYTPFEESFEVTGAYSQYNVPVIRKDDIPDDAVVVFPEIYPHLFPLFPQKKAFWWLSVDNHGSHGTGSLDEVWVHLAQSEYARKHVEKAYGKKPLMLTDYINSVYTPSDNMDRIPRVAVNPVKGGNQIDSLGVDNIKLHNMSREQVKQELEESMIYVDFGHHPGRDRFPREACLSGAVVFTSRIGAANNPVDIPIDEWFKFNTVDELGPKIKEVFENYSEFRNKQLGYLRTILCQQEVFTDEVRALVYLFTNPHQ